MSETNEPKFKLDPSLQVEGGQGIASFGDHFPEDTEAGVQHPTFDASQAQSSGSLPEPPSEPLPRVSQIGSAQTPPKDFKPGRKVDPWAKRRPSRITEHETFIGHDPETGEEVEFTFFGAYMDGIDVNEWQDRAQQLCMVLLAPNSDGTPQYYPAPGGAPIRLNAKTITTACFMEVCQELAEIGPEFTYGFHEIIGIAVNFGGVFNSATLWYNQFMPSAERKSEIREKLGNLAGSHTA